MLAFLARMFSRSITIAKNQKGSIITLAALSMVGVIGMAALVIDGGMLYLTRAQLINEADASALAGAQELPGRPSQALQVANSYAYQNGKPGDTPSTILSNNNTSLTVTVIRHVDFLFAPILNLFSSNVAATSTAQVSPYTGGSIGVVPFGVVKQNFKFGETYLLKAGAGDGYNGNYRALALGGSGGISYQNNLMFGYQGSFKIGDWIFTEPGDMSGPTAKGIKYRIDLDPYATFDTVQNGSGRIVTVPVIDSIAVSGRDDVLVVGFAAFFLEGSGKRGNDSYVYGRFRQMVLPGDISTTATTYGLYGVTLTQ